VNGLDNKAGFAELKKKHGNSKPAPAARMRQRVPRLPAPGM